MKHHVLAALLLMNTAAFAADEVFFGRIDPGPAPRPEVINAQPVQAVRGTAGGAAAPVYLHVRPGHDQRWGAHCQSYDACTVPVLFVTENWYRNIYLPLVGGSEARDQRYRDTVRLERIERDNRHR